MDWAVGRRGSCLLHHSYKWYFDWVRPPILTLDPRLAMIASPHAGRMLLQGLEKGGPAVAGLDQH